MAQVDAYVNWGRWVFDCPKCNTCNEIKGRKKVVCLSDYPELGAVMHVKSSGTRGVHGFVPIADLEAREIGRDRAMQQGEEYQVVYKVNKEKVDKLLHPRHIRNSHWYPHESLADLRQENDEHGVK